MMALSAIVSAPTALRIVSTIAGGSFSVPSRRLRTRVDKLSEPLGLPALLPLTPLGNGFSPSGVTPFLSVPFWLSVTHC